MITALRLARPAVPVPSPPLRHRCSCGGVAGTAGLCAECAAKVRHEASPIQKARSPGESHEAEAERVAERVVASPAPTAAAAPPPPRVMPSRGGGRPLTPVLRNFFEPRLGQDLGHVRLHADAAAASEARALRARAFTRGADISFAVGQYDPGSAAGRRLLAHELTHALQQSGAPSFRPAMPGLPQRAPDPDAPATPPAPVAPRVWGMLAHLQEWSAAGLLDPPFRPATVGAIPPLPVSEKTAAKLGLNTPKSPSMAGAALATAATAAKVAEPIVTASRPVLTVIEGGEVVTALKPIPAPGGAPLRLLGPLAIGLTVFLWPSETAPPWLDELNPITGEPYGSQEEYRWVRRLTPEQQDYLRRLDRAKQEEPDPGLEAERDPEAAPQPTTTLAPGPELGPFPEPQPQPDPKKKDRDRNCIGFDVPRLGGHKVHDAYADKVTRSSFDYYAAPPVPFRGINYDGRTPMTPLVWEVKVGHGWFFNPKKASLRDLTLARWDAQKDLGMSIARQCGYSHLWSIPDRWVAGMLNTRWAGTPPVLAVPR